MFCKIGEGCAIYDKRPQVCKDFNCLWLIDETMPDAMRPDRVHLYASGKQADEGLKIIVDADYPEAWRTGTGADVVDHFLNKGFHLLVVIDKQINFLKGRGRAQPEKLMIDWLL